MKKDQSDKIVRKVFLAFAPVQALAVGLPGINGLLNSLIVSSNLGVSALAAVGFVAPFTSIVGAVSAVMSSGAQIMCGRYLGRGDLKSIRSTFTTAILMCALCGLVFSLLGMIVPTGIALLLGASGEMTEMTSNYFLGMAPGYLFNILFACLLPFLQMDNAKKTSTIAVAASLVTAVGCNLLNAAVLKWGLLGVGLSTTAGNLVSVLVSLPHFLFKSNTYRFSVKGLSRKTAADIVKQGYPSSINAVALAMRDRVMNQILFSVGGSAAMSALTVANNITAVIVSVNGGYSGSASLVSSVLVGERDTKSLRSMTRTIFKSFGWLYYVVYALVFIFAKPIAQLFGAEADKLDLYAMAIRLINMFMVTNAFKEAPLSLYRSMGKINLTSIFFVLNGFAFPMLVAAVAGNDLGILYAAPPISEVLMLLIYTAYFRFKAGRFPGSLLNLTYVPDSLGVPDTDCYSATIQNAEEAIAASTEICRFCEEKHLPKKTAMYCGLCFEEMAMDTLKHGFPEKNREEYAVDVRMIYENNGMSMMIRDNCPGFDPTEWLKLYAAEDPSRSIGIKLVSRIAARMDYSCTLGLNVMNIRLNG
ncbi:MAG: MATE family efflux transporter [Clostridia bacterium]|nr:MATE family efflux transporter [Clostridia bacterium]